MAPIHLPWAERRTSPSRRSSLIVCVPSPCPRAKMLPTESQARASSSETRQYSNTPSPIPPHSAGMVIPHQPFSHLVDKTPRHLRLLGIELVRNWKHDIQGKRAGLDLQFDTCSGSLGRLQVGRLRL